ncbi:hypothetical protein GKE82_01830 [Conexibacter sp. W3-3-2]|uniref:Uncharacterized protein n=1 Tax=Paraconexibacter algicola TaxID=2133960 RepID=A0A2T4UCA1_9ACTN|nr:MULTISPECIES: hypothetical protein [Solirubrobacterales]MTD43076.1 hypothetical protein [Conexibacter sp. W3-3-2]PTL54836.1 hypothetical protein C7Y72_19820 [Paraconexibacter algicola]
MDAVALSRPIRGALACAFLAAAFVLALSLQQERRVDRAESALERGNGEQAVALARRSDGPTVRPRALRIEALAALRLGELVPAERAFRAAIDRSPEDWTLRYDHAIVLRQLGREDAAAAEMGRVLQLNPLAALPPGFVSRTRR